MPDFKQVFASMHNDCYRAAIASSCGLPVVASDIPEIRDMWPGDAWLLEPVDDVTRFAEALRQVRAKRDALQQEACAIAPAFRQRFSMKACAERYLEVYKEANEGTTHHVDVKDKSWAEVQASLPVSGADECFSNSKHQGKM